MKSEFRVEPLGPAHDRATFQSGILELDSYLRTQASQDVKRRAATAFVLLDSSGAILGYYTLSATGMRPTEMPAELLRKLPRYSLIPATWLGRFAISRSHQGLGLGRLLLADALVRSLKNTSEIASTGVLVQAIDERAREFYVHHQFIPLADHPNRLFLPMGTIEKAVGHR